MPKLEAPNFRPFFKRSRNFGCLPNPPWRERHPSGKPAWKVVASSRLDRGFFPRPERAKLARPGQTVGTFYPDGRYWARTSRPLRVKQVLFQLS